MKRKLKVATMVVLLLFVAIQLYQPRMNKDGGKVYETDFMQSYNVPVDIQRILKTSCYDCHSNNTTYAWYDYIQPARFFVEQHISEAKEELNFNVWSNYSERKQVRLLESIQKQIKTKKMPLPSYIRMYEAARLSDTDIKNVNGWLNQIIAKAEQTL